ncbi:DUF4105 domain-containing protein [Polaribacter tangerinus]|uniref:lipoprotein N-acyltransferase Lnb domain-containing protein n=1 Tax=Polaribacter tangerinus TaxID=1920034 RepID=UPI000B4B7352|nr:DUF4105 domain-containing protein [Polaribacter tangerinus]
MIKKIFLSVLIVILTLLKTTAQVNLSVYSEISIITAGPGEKLYEKFGHSAIRVKDPVLNLDLIYNYGIFDFNAPNFLLNFAQGKMFYLLARYDFKYFLASYKNDKRWLKEQILNLNQAQKQHFFSYLENNALKENATYLYDPFFNNCATKIKDISKTILSNNIVFEDIVTNTSLRNLLNKEIHFNSWGNVGINLITGTILDTKRTKEAYMYLPDYVYSYFKTAKIVTNNSEIPLVKKENVLLDFKEPRTTLKLFSPAILFSFLFSIILWFTWRDFKAKNGITVIDVILFFLTGFVGLILSYLWLFSDHSTAPNNFNIFWAFPVNLIFAFIIRKKKYHLFLSKYISLLLVLFVTLIALLVLEIQTLPLAIIPFLAALVIRYVYINYVLLTSIK